jgi:hypothetical protein
MASKRAADFFTLPSVLEDANAVCGMWELGCPEEACELIPPEMRAPTFDSRPQDPHDRERVAHVQYGSTSVPAVICMPCIQYKSSSPLMYKHGCVMQPAAIS